MKRLLAISCLVAMTAVGGALGVRQITASTSKASDRIQFTHVLGHSPAVGGSTHSDIIAGVFKRYGGQDVVSVSEEGAPAQPGPRPAGIWLHFVVAVPSREVGTDRAQWEADLIEGAIADALASSGTTVGGSTIDWRLPDGTILPNQGGGMGDIVPGQTFSNASDASITATLKKGLADNGLIPTSIAILHADQAAPAVIAVTSDPRAAAAAASSTIRALFGQNPPFYEGYYFEVRDLSGKPLFIQSASFRSGSGRQWVDPSLADVTSLLHL
jgi:hypothetical protein